MPYTHDKINLLPGGWYVVYNNGKVITEEDNIPWSAVEDKRNIKLMGLKRHNKYLEIEGKESYIPPGETHVREITYNNYGEEAVTKQSLQGWFIGYYDKDCKVIKRISSLTGEMMTEYIPYK